jgi:hypothetical protein
MMREAFHLFGEAVRVERFDSLYEAGMESPPSLVKEAAIGHLVAERVLEHVNELGEEVGLIEELGCL